MVRLEASDVAQFSREGWLLVPDLITAGDVRILRSEIASLEERHHEAPPPGLFFSPGRPRELWKADGLEHNIAMLGGPLSNLLQYRPLVECAQQLIGSEQIKLTGALYLDGGRSNGGHECASASPDCGPLGGWR